MVVQCVDQCQVLDNVQYQALRLCTGAFKINGNGGDAPRNEKDAVIYLITGLIYRAIDKNIKHTVNHNKIVFCKGEKGNKKLWMDSDPKRNRSLYITIKCHSNSTITCNSTLDNCRQTFSTLEQKNKFMYNLFIIQEYTDRYHSYVQIYTDTSKKFSK